MFILFDLDGTLLTDNKIILEKDLNHLALLEEKGHQLAIATGRRFFSAREILVGHGLHLPIIGNNGSIIRDSSDQLIYRRPLDKKILQFLLALARAYNLAPVFHVDGFHKAYDMVYHSEYTNDDLEAYLLDGLERTRQVKDFDFLKQEAILSLVYFGQEEDLVPFEENLRAQFPGRLNTHILRNLGQHKAILEIMDGRVNKFRGAQILLRHMGYNEEDLISVGDDMNDLALIRYAKVSFAMKNGAEALKKEATYVTRDDNNQGGALGAVLDYLEEVDNEH